MPDQGPIFQGDHPSNLIGWPTFQPSRLAGTSTVVNTDPFDPFEPFVDYVTARLTEDPHLWARTLFDELEQLGFGLSYQSLTRNIRSRDLRPVCEVCRSVIDRPNAVIAHPAGEETQWDWLELPEPPGSWGWARKPCCWSDPWLIPASGEQCCPRRWINRIWWPRSTASCAASEA
jgi:hypothetical protein